MCLQKNHKFKLYIAFTLYLLGLSVRTNAQQFDPFDGNAQIFHVKLTRYFKTQPEEVAKRAQLLDSVKLFDRDSIWTVSNLSSHLDTYEKLLVGLNRHYEYYRLSSYANNKDTLARQALGQVNNAMSIVDNRVGKLLLQPQFTSLSEKNYSRYGLTKYKYLLSRAKEQASHNLSVHDEQLINKLTDKMLDHLTDRYDNLMDNIKAEDIMIGEKKVNPLTNRAAILKNPDAEARAKGSKAFYETYDKHAEIFAATLIDITLQRTTLAKLRGYNSAPERAYAARLELPETSVKEMFKEMTFQADVLKNYQQVQVQQIQHITGLEKVHSWDLALSTGFVWQPMPYAQVSQLILKALSPLGTAYQQNFAWLLEPSNGALEIAGGPNRVTENTSIAYPGTPTSLYMKGYAGSLRDILALSHEGGHAIHRKLMGDNHIVPTNSDGPNFLFEAYAMFNELLMLDELEKEATTIEGKAYFTKQFLDKLSLEIFTSAEEGAFEQGLYDGVAAGSINNADDVNTLYAGIMAKYDSFFADEPERRSEWINKRLVFDDPLYNVNYLYAMLVTCKLYTIAHNNPAEFAVKYTVLLKNGFDAPAEDLLKKFMGFGLDNKALLNSALQMMRDKTATLKSLYTQINLKK